MIYISTALELEAGPIIEKLNLKKNTDHHLYNVYTGGDFALIVSGVGKIASAMAATYMLTTLGVPAFFVNTGIAAGDAGTGIYLINSITDIGSGRSVYPSMLINMDLPEKPLLTSDSVIEDHLIKPDFIYDMEGFGFYLAASKFMTNDRIVLIKYISDIGAIEGKVDREAIEKAITDNSSLAADKIKELTLIPPKDESTIVDKARFDAFADYYLMSATSRSDLMKLLTYASYKGRDSRFLLQINEAVDKASRKQAGIRFIEELKHELLP